MNQERTEFWYGVVYDAAEAVMKELEFGEPDRLQEAKERLLLRRYLCDSLPDWIENVDEADCDDAEGICREIYPTLMEDVLTGFRSEMQQMSLAMLLMEFENGVDDEFTFSRLLGEIQDREVTLKEAHDLMVAADAELDRYISQAGGADLSYEDMTYWVESGSFYEGSNADVMARIMDAAIQALRELRSVHERAMIHTDVRPENMHLYSDGTLKLAGDGNNALGGCEPAYAAPEQMSGERGISANPVLGIATDLYSWALSFLYLLLGERLWQYGPDAACRSSVGGDMLEALLQESRVPVVVMLQGILRDYLQEDPKKRPHNLQDERVLDIMLTKVYEGAIHREYKKGEALRKFLDEEM